MWYFQHFLSSSSIWEEIIDNWSLLTTRVRRMDNVAVYQNGDYTHNINRFFTRVTSNTIDYILLETKYTS